METDISPRIRKGAPSENHYFILKIKHTNLLTPVRSNVLLKNGRDQKYRNITRRFVGFEKKKTKQKNHNILRGTKLNRSNRRYLFCV